MKKVLDLSNLNTEERQSLFGSQDINIKCLNEIFDIYLEEREDSLWCDTDKEKKVSACLKDIVSLIDNGVVPDEALVSRIAQSYLDKEDYNSSSLFEKSFGKSHKQLLIYPKTNTQKILLEKMEEKDMIFVLGPAGTGKTYLSVVYAVNALKKNKFKKIIITRPVVEAGESLGFLPGDLNEKIDPYLRPVYDALDDILGASSRMRLCEQQIIEIAPLAYMRGRTLDEAVVILDEAQNTTDMQMKMFLTRMGFHTKMIINGDLTQIDLDKKKKSGLVDACERLKDIEEIAFVEFDNNDVVRHPLVRKILNKYED